MKIAIITSFAEFHLLELLIPNIIETIDPDKIFISEGRMKSGPENKGFKNDDEFVQKWTYNGEGIVGFDWELTKELEIKYPKLVKVHAFDYNSNFSATDCYIHSISSIEEFQPNVGDLIYCFESDSFLLESDAQIINDEVSKLNVGDGLTVKYVDFLETQYYTENVNVQSPKYRRLVYRFDTWVDYRFKMGSGYLSQNYNMLRKVDSFFIRHYAWFRPNKYKQLRYELIYRSNPQYWKDFDDGLCEIKRVSEQYHSNEMMLSLDPKSRWFPDKITIRPSRTDEGRYAKFIDIDHPKHIKSHPNFVK